MNAGITHNRIQKMCITKYIQFIVDRHEQLYAGTKENATFPCLMTDYFTFLQDPYITDMELLVNP